MKILKIEHIGPFTQSADFQLEVNNFLEDISPTEIVDIKYSASGWGNENEMESYTAMIIYSYEKGI